MLFSVAAALAPACGNQNAHPANTHIDCEAGGCNNPPPKGGGGGKDGGSDAKPDSSGSVTVSGTVKLLASDDFATASEFTQPATVEMEGPDGLTVQGDYDGSTFKVEGVADTAVVWATVTPKVKTTALTTVQIASTDAGDIRLHVVAPAVIQSIYALLTTPADLVPGASHVVIRFVDKSTGAPVQGITVSHDSEVVAYDTGGGWSDVAAGTGPAGYAVVVNVAGGATPSTQKFTIKSGTINAAAELQIAPDAVTLADVLVTP
jgi:hypothetical protein